MPVVKALLMALLAMASAASAGAQTTQDDPFLVLRRAYAARDAAAAASAYASDAQVTYAYAGSPEENHRGTAEIEASFAALFAQIALGDAIDLNFRVTEREGDRAAGFYRLRLGEAASYGHFAVRFAADGRFAEDRSSDAGLADFEDAAGPVMLDPGEETLDPAYYDRFAGRYTLPDGCTLVVTRSIVRLFARNACTNTWRGLTRQSGREWAAGTAVLSDQVDTRYRFAPGEGESPEVVLEGPDGPLSAVRNDAYRREPVSFEAEDGTRLAGTAYIPANASGRLPAAVIVHGSGEQDRNGYASIIAMLADALAARGRIVLTYDKRGVGESAGDWTRAGFDMLGGDAVAAMRHLAEREDVDPARIGLAGSSQAGWVAAAAIADGAMPSDVFLLGAAGSALTVPEQNLYNTEVRMRCTGIAEADIALALDQQRAFFAFLADPARTDELDRLTAEARQRPALADWLFPSSSETVRDGGEWYTTLDPAFDPLPVWRAYHGRLSVVLSEYDDSTPTPLARTRLIEAGIEPVVLAGAQHLGLVAPDLCRAELGDVSAFSPELFEALERF